MTAAESSAGPTAPSGGPPGIRRLRVLLAGWTLRWFGVSFYVPYLLLYFHDSLGLDFVWGGLLIGGVAALAPPLALVGGGLSDRFGRRRLIVASLAVEAAALGVLAVGILREFLPVILAGMVGSQLCSSLGTPSTIAYVGDVTDPRQRTTAVAWVRIGINVGYSGGIALGGVLLVFLAFWEMTALASFVVGAGAVVGLLLLEPSTRDLELTKTGSTGLLSAAGKLGSTLEGVGQSLRRSTGTLRRHPVLLELGLACGLSYLMFQQLNYSISTFGLQDLALSYGLVGAALAVNGVTCVVLPIRLPEWVVGWRLTRVGAVGAGVIGVGLFAFGLDGTFRVAVVAFYFAAVLTMSVGECFATLPPYALSLNLAPADQRGAFAGAISMSTGMVASLSAIFAGAALTVARYPLLTWAILAAPAGPSVAIFGHLRSRFSRDRDRV